MGGTAPYCPFCKKYRIGLKNHIKAAHPNQYKDWIKDGMQPYWRYDSNGHFISTPKDIIK